MAVQCRGVEYRNEFEMSWICQLMFHLYHQLEYARNVNARTHKKNGIFAFVTSKPSFLFPAKIARRNLPHRHETQLQHTDSILRHARCFVTYGINVTLSATISYYFFRAIINFSTCFRYAIICVDMMRPCLFNKSN